mgnify:CR=1 FL=1
MKKFNFKNFYKLFVKNYNQVNKFIKFNSIIINLNFIVIILLLLLLMNLKCFILLKIFNLIVWFFIVSMFFYADFNEKNYASYKIKRKN